MTTTLAKPTDQQVCCEVYNSTAMFERFDPADEAKMGKGKPKRLGRLTFEFEVADTLNENRRVYPREVVAMAVAEIQPRLERNQVFGRLDHPPPWEWESARVSLADAAIKVQEVGMISEGRQRVVVDICDNEHGEQLISIIESGGNPGISQRAFAVWKDMEADDKARFGVPEDEFAVVAERLRLITFDIVGEPGFSEAHSPDAQENKHQQELTMNRDELKVKHPSLYAEIVNEGKTAGLAELDSKIEIAVEDRKPQLIADAVKEANEKVTAAEERANEAVAVLEQVKPVMVKLGIVNEQITDVEAAKQVTTLEGKVAALEAERDSVKAELDAAQTKIAAFEGAQNTYNAVKAARDKYAEHAFRDDIVKAVADRKPATADEALAIADEHASLIERYAGKDGKPKDQTVPVLDGIFDINSLVAPANTDDPQGGKVNSSTADESNAMTQFAMGGAF